MIVYSIKADTDNYQSAQLKDETLWNSQVMGFRCSEVEEDWQTPTFIISNPDLKRGNFIPVREGIFIIDEKAFHCLSPQLIRSGEVLPIILEGEPKNHYIYNVTNCYDCLNYEASIKPDAENKKASRWGENPVNGEKIYIKNYIFHPDRFTESPFLKIPQQPQGPIFFTERLYFRIEGEYAFYNNRKVLLSQLSPNRIDTGQQVTKEEVRYILEHNNLTGLLYEPIWDSETG